MPNFGYQVLGMGAHQQGGVTYLLRATGATDAAEDGTKNYTETDGSIAASGGVYDVTAQSTPAWGDLGWVSNDLNAPAGYGYFFTLNGSAIETTSLHAGWTDNGIAQANMMNAIYVDGSGDVDIYVNGAAKIASISAVTNSTDEKFVIIKGGYDASGVPMDAAANIASYPYGATYFQYDGSNWKLFYKSTTVVDTGQDYPAMSFGNYGGTYDLPMVPDVSLASLLNPIVMDTFTDSNGTLLTAHTPDVDTVGSGWVAIHGVCEIQSNQCWTKTIGGAPQAWSAAAIETNKSDVVIEVDPTGIATGTAAHIYLRITDINNAWVIYAANGSTAPYQTLKIYEVNAGTVTQRATTSWTPAPRIFAVADGTTIKAHSNGTLITYGSATLNQTETTHGIGNDPTSATLCGDNFAIYAVGNGGEHSALSAYDGS